MLNLHGNRQGHGAGDTFAAAPVRLRRFASFVKADLQPRRCGVTLTSAESVAAVLLKDCANGLEMRSHKQQ